MEKATRPNDPPKTIEMHMEVNYQYGSDGNFTKHAGYDYLKQEDLLVHDVWKLTHEKIEEVRRQVRAGKVSPVAYHMERCMMEVPVLASIAGISSWRVRRHMKVKIFNRLRHSTLKKYASAFEIPVEELSKV
jgi:hypothetical protein